MRLSDGEINEYIELHHEVKGERLSFDEADEIVHRMLNLFMLLSEPLPEKVGTEKERT